MGYRICSGHCRPIYGRETEHEIRNLVRYTIPVHFYRNQLGVLANLNFVYTEPNPSNWCTGKSLINTLMK